MNAPTPASGQLRELPRELPLVGRASDIDGLATLFGEAGRVESLLLLTGETGIGKSRLAATLVGEAVRRGWKVVQGRAYPVETGVPYAVFSDAFLPLFRDMDPAQLTVLSRGSQEELHRLFPPLGDAPPGTGAGTDPGELRARLFWSFSEFLKRLGAREPLLILLEDLHWAAPSTLALLHFLARQLGDEPVRILGSYNTDHRQDNDQLVRLERSLLSLRVLRLHHLRPLTGEDTTELLVRVFGVHGSAVEAFSRLLYGWTKGNPYFIEQTLVRLVQTGRLHQRDGTWLGWEAGELELPPTVSDAVLLRLSSAGEDATALGEALAVAGGRAPTDVVASSSGLSADRLDAATEGLLRNALIEESDDGYGGVHLGFRHPLVRETLYRRLSLTRRARLHGRVAEALERRYGPGSDEHADELAYHFARGGEAGQDERATRYLAAAGKAALRRHADREAATYLQEALARSTEPRAAPEEDDAAARPQTPTVSDLRRNLAKAQARLGRYPEALALWEDLLSEAQESGDPSEIADAHRHLALLAFWSGRYREALDSQDRAVAAVAGNDPALEARLHLAAGVAFQVIGRTREARARLQQALPLAESVGASALLARIHRALALVQTWVGEPGVAREHAWRSIAMARECGDRVALFWARWVLSALEGLTGDTSTMHELLVAARADAEDLGSPVLRLWVTELAIQYHWAAGDWDEGLAEGEAAISLARSLNQKVILTRLLIWTALIYLGRGSVARARDLCEEAWELSGADAAGGDPVDVHSVIPAHLGLTAVAVAEGDLGTAIRIGEAGLAIADRSGYVTWALHLLPHLIEAYVRSHRLGDAAAGGERLRAEGERMRHPLAMAWARACDALVDWFSDRIPEAVQSLREAAESLERIPIVPEAARIRRQLAGRLADLGRRDEALVELRHVHEVFGRLGAQPELDKTREMFREVGSRPPSRSTAEGTAGLTAREAEVAGLVAGRASNKAIAKQLGIAPRTVTTHLSNIYRKLGVRSRGELADMVREARIAVD